MAKIYSWLVQNIILNETSENLTSEISKINSEL